MTRKATRPGGRRPRAFAAARPPARKGTRVTVEGHPSLEVTGPVASQELLAYLLWEAGTTGLEELGPGRLSAFFVEPPGQAVLETLRAAGATRVVRARLAASDWVGSARRLHRAVRVGPLLLRAPWSRARPRAGERELVIDPARAFGTGSHESTRLVLDALSRRVSRGLTVLDVGCGSGVLALRAAQLGAGTIVAIDSDPEAVRATDENARRNRLADRVRGRLGTAREVRRRFDLVLANLTAPILERERGSIRDRVSPGGSLVLAGFLRGDVARIGAAYTEMGLRVIDTRSEEEWALLELEAPGRRRAGGSAARAGVRARGSDDPERTS